MTDQIPTIVTYHSTNNKPEWFAYLKPNGEFLGVRMEGSTEEEAIERAKNWWINERAHQTRICGQVELDDSEVGSRSYKPIGSAWGNAPAPTDGWSSIPNHNSWSTAPVKGGSAMGHDHSMTGKVWLMNHDLKQRLRAEPGEVPRLLANGWERAGPKTGFRS